MCERVGWNFYSYRVCAICVSVVPSVWIKDPVTTLRRLGLTTAAGVVVVVVFGVVLVVEVDEGGSGFLNTLSRAGIVSSDSSTGRAMYFQVLVDVLVMGVVVVEEGVV